MKAIVQRKFGSPDVLEFSDIDDPEMSDDEVLVRVRAASVGAWDWHMMRPTPHIMRIAGAGLLRPKRSIRGIDMAGRVEAVGPSVTWLQPGDEVYGEGDGTFAEYTCAKEAKLGPKPESLTAEQAAAVPIAASTALIGLRDKGGIESGQKVLIIGASGGVGTFAVQIAKVFGAEVTGVCSPTAVDLVRSIGADHVIDYTRQDFADDGQRYDLIFELAGHRSPAELRRVLAPSGTLVLSSGEGGPWIGPIGRLARALAVSPFVGQTLCTFVAETTSENLALLAALIEAGEVTPIIDRTYPLSEAAEAIRYLERGHARGKTVLAV